MQGAAAPSGSAGAKKRKGGSAAKYDPLKRQQQSDPRRTKLHVNAPQNLRGYAGVMCTYEGNEGAATIELHRLFSQHLELVYPEEEPSATEDASKGTPALQSDAAASDSNSDRSTRAPALTASDELKRELASLGYLDDDSDPKSAGRSSSNKSMGARSAKLSTVRTNCKGVVMLRAGGPVRRWANAPSAASQSAEPNEEEEDGSALEVPPGSTPDNRNSAVDQQGEGASRHPPWKKDRAQADNRSTSEHISSSSSQALQLLPLVDPVAVLRSVFLAVADSREACSRHVVRIVPLQLTCYAGLEEIEEAIMPLLKAQFGAPDKASHTFMVVVKRRNNYKLDKDGLISRLVDLILAQNPKHTVALKGAEVAVVVEVNQALAGVSVVGGGDYGRFEEFNLKKYQTKHCASSASADDPAKLEASNAE